MSRIKESIIQRQNSYAGHSPVLDLAYGGQNGHSAAIGKVGADGKNYDEWISNQAYVKQNIIPIVLSYPKAFDFMPNPQSWIDTYNALMTLHPLTISGFTSGLTVDFDEHAIGSAGEMQEELTKVSRARTTINKTYKEKAGKSIQKFIDMVIRYLYSDPDVDKPLVSNLVPNENFGGLYTPDYYTGTHIYIEPDITQSFVVDAWLCTNVMFKGNGDRTGKRDTHSARETLDLSIDFTSITMNNEAVLQLADSLLANLSVLNAMPDMSMVVPQSTIDAKLGAGLAAGRSTEFNATPPNNVAMPAAQ